MYMKMMSFVLITLCMVNDVVQAMDKKQPEQRRTGKRKRKAPSRYGENADDGSKTPVKKQKTGHRCDVDRCRYTNSSTKVLKLHKDLHKIKDVLTCDEEGCYFLADHQTLLSCHKSLIHNDNHVLRCCIDGCEFIARSKDAREMHLMLHFTRNVWQCIGKSAINDALPCHFLCLDQDSKATSNHILSCHKNVANPGFKQINIVDEKKPEQKANR